MSSSSELATRTAPKPAPRLGSRVKKQRLIALVGIDGLSVRSACEQLGLGTTRFYEWYNGDADFRRRLEEAKDQVFEAITNAALERAVQKLRQLGPKAIGVVTSALDSNDESTQMRAARMVLRHIQEFQTKNALQVEPEGFLDLLKGANDPAGGRPLTD